MLTALASNYRLSLLSADQIKTFQETFPERGVGKVPSKGSFSKNYGTTDRAVNAAWPKYPADQKVLDAIHFAWP